MTPIEQITSNIDAKTAQKLLLIREADALQQNGNDWLQNSTNTCNQTLKKNRENCENEKARKIALGNDYLSQAASKRSEAAALQVQIDKLLKDKESIVLTSNQVSEILATQGTTQEAISTVASGNAEAIKSSQEIKARAEADAISKTAEVDADSKQKITYVAIGVGVLVVIIIGVLIYKKIKKKKK